MRNTVIPWQHQQPHCGRTDLNVNLGDKLDQTTSGTLLAATDVTGAGPLAIQTVYICLESAAEYRY